MGKGRGNLNCTAVIVSEALHYDGSLPLTTTQVHAIIKHMVGVFYFSSTGNSLYIAKRISSHFQTTAHYIPTFKGDLDYDKIIIVSPIYYFGLPVPVYEFLVGLPSTASVTVVLNYGGMVGAAGYYAYKVGVDHGVNIQAVFSVKMPENFTLFFSTPQFYNRLVLKSCEKKIDKIIERIQANEQVIPKQKKIKQETIEDRKAKWHLLAKNFSVKETCTTCKKCIGVCPVQNITLKDEKIIFLDKCIACLSCYHRCPQKAIVYKNRTKKDRYINPKINESEIGFDVG